MPTLYIDLMSQPSRACYILCKKHGLPVDVQMIRLDKGEHKKPAYLQINPLGKVPFLVDGDLRLPESAAIMAYLCDKYSLPDNWHPGSSSSSSDQAAAHQQQQEQQRRAVYESAVHWQHLNIRAGCMRLVFHTVIGPRVFKVPAVPQVAADGLKVLQQALKDLESYWLGGGSRPFMTGQQVSTPDLLCVCDLEQLRMMVAEPSQPQLEQLLAPHPIVRQWMAAVRAAVGPALYDEAHGKLAAAVARLAAAAAAKPAARL
uniref:Glutathione transferase n=1 Tax=Tetradesmus obliquus TaxID=3088 RepID=A0A383VA58_TETOB|eukprot:jgi/Sobl393_1/7379/SZX61652.1